MTSWPKHPPVRMTPTGTRWPTGIGKKTIGRASPALTPVVTVPAQVVPVVEVIVVEVIVVEATVPRVVAAHPAAEAANIVHHRLGNRVRPRPMIASIPLRADRLQIETVAAWTKPPTIRLPKLPNWNSRCALLLKSTPPLPLM